MIPFGEWRPDVSDFAGEHTRSLLNVLPRGDGYGPMPSMEVLTSALAAACRGYFTARNADGTVAIFAGTSTKLYKLSNTDLTWSDVSLGAGSYSALSSDANWSFRQFGLNVIAVQENVAPQVYTLGSSSAFAAIGGSPPQAAYAAVVGQFLVLSGLLSTPRKIKWSAINDITGWTAGTNQSGEVTFQDGGDVRGVAGGEYGVIVQETAIRHMTYVPNSSVIFDIERISRDDGIWIPGSLVEASERSFFLSRKGFRMMMPGSLPVPIGAERVDRTIIADIDETAPQMMSAVSDPKNNRVYWAYKSINGAVGLFDKLICYDYQLQRWTRASVSGEYISAVATPGITLDALDSVSSSIDALTLSLDEYSTSDFPNLSAANSDHKISLFTGAAIEATLETAEQTNNGKRFRVQGFRPITDAPTTYGSVSKRENLQDSISYSSETLVNDQGMCPANVSTRYARGKVRIPASTEWTYASGIEPEWAEDGRR